MVRILLFNLTLQLRHGLCLHYTFLIICIAAVVL